MNAAATTLEKPREDDYRILSRRPGFLIRRLHQIHIALFAEECGSFKATPVQYSLMTVLESRPGIEQTVLAGEVGIDRTTTANVLSRLEKRKLVTRRRGQSDGRLKLVRLTAAGSKLLQAMEDAVQRVHDRTVESLPEAERTAFLRSLSRLVDDKNRYGRAPMRLP